jgi:hypothetical protein
LTFVVFLLLPSLRSSLPGKIQMVFVFALFVAYFTQSVENFLGIDLLKPEDSQDYNRGCKFFGFFYQVNTFFK